MKDSPKCSRCRKCSSADIQSAPTTQNRRRASILAANRLRHGLWNARTGKPRTPSHWKRRYAVMRIRHELHRRQVMEALRQVIDTLCAWLLMPATLVGGAGGLLSSVRAGRCMKRSLFEALCGAVVANVTFPLIVAYFPPAWHFTLFFIAGIGGLKMVMTVYGWLFDDGLVRDILCGILKRMTGGK